jgi:hypothetical protein
MGDSIEQWRATIGQWSGGRTRKCVTSQHHITQNSNPLGYGYIRFILLVSLLVIGCVELNPGPDYVRYVIIYIYVCAKGLWVKLCRSDGRRNGK